VTEAVIAGLIIGGGTVATVLGLVAILAASVEFEAMRLDTGRFYLGLDSSPSPAGRFWTLGLGRWALGMFPTGLEVGPPEGVDPCNCHGACPLPEPVEP
jgi:hypothetical protein